MKVRIFEVVCVLLSLLVASQVEASSNMSDGIITEIEPDGSFVMRVIHSPYSSEVGMTRRATLTEKLTQAEFAKRYHDNPSRKSNSGEKGYQDDLKVIRKQADDPRFAKGGYVPKRYNFAPNWRKQGPRFTSSGRGFSSLTYWIDETPVTIDQFKAALKVGMRITVMENGNLHFMKLSPRGEGNMHGIITKADQESFVLTRQQVGGGPDMYPIYEMTPETFPHHQTKIKVEAGAMIKRDGKLKPYDPNDFKSNEWVIVQAPRLKQCVELLPPNYGEWQKLVNSMKSIGRDAGFGPYMFENCFYGIGASEGTRKGKPGEVDMRYQTRRYNNEHVEKMKKSVAKEAYDAILLAGGHEKPGRITRAHYSKGGVAIIDGQYTDAWGRNSNWKSMIRTGRPFAAICRRGRTTPDKYFISSDLPSAWGVITSVGEDQYTVELAADELRGTKAVSFKIAQDAEYFHLGLPVKREDVLKVGSLIQVYDARPQTILINDGKDHLPTD